MSDRFSKSLQSPYVCLLWCHLRIYLEWWSCTVTKMFLVKVPYFVII